MSLRKFVQGLRERDWLSVVLEVLIVVVGVIIALQVSNWNDDRKDAVRGNDYLLRMQNELRGDVRRLDDISGFWAAVNGQGLAALAHAEHGTLLDGSAWKTLLAYYQASQIWPYRKDNTTFQEIRASGEFGLIRDPALRARISSHYASGSNSEVSEVLGLIPAYRERVRGLTPWAIQEYIWATCYSGAAGTQQLLDCPPPISEEEALTVLQAFRESPELLQQLRFWMATTSVGITLMANIQGEADSLAQAIEQRRH
ncbi:MAG: hypothetical protein KA196_03560 [Arenimonas sp.]|nr:hypothetical protein [Arenimonas sp.]